MQEINGLVFYKAGKFARASQPHKHLQLILFSENIDGFDVLIEKANTNLLFIDSQPTKIAILLFRYAITPIPENYDGKTFFKIHESLLQNLNSIYPSLMPGEQT